MAACGPLVRVDKTERRLALLRAARDVFAARGYHDAKVEDIVAAAKVAKGTFYLYFRDKRSVLEELVDSLFVRIGAAIVRIDIEKEVEPQLQHNVRAIVATFLDDPALTQIVLSWAAGLDPAFVEKVQSFYEGARTRVRDALAEGQRLGIVAEGDPAFQATFAIGALKEILLESTSTRKPRALEAIVRELFRFLGKGLLIVPVKAAVARPPAPRAPRRRAAGGRQKGRG
jgi:AcrR family transcriptional regulator